MTTRLRQVSSDTALHAQPCTCIDGRTPGERHSVAGGSFALLVDAVHAAAPVDGHRLTAAGAAEWAALFVGQVSTLYLHSDVAALQRILAAMGLSPDTRLGDFNKAQQRTFIELATRPDMQGCSHLRMMLEEPRSYGVSGRTVAHLIRAFFHSWFAGEPGVRFDVLAGTHRESSVVISDVATSADQVSLFSADEPAFYCSLSTKWQLLERLAEAAVQAGWLTPADGSTVVEAAYARHNESAERTLTTLAQHLPRFVVTH